MTDENNNKTDTEVVDDVVLEAENDSIDVDENDTDAPEVALKKLRAKLKQCQKERQEYLDGWQRSKADLLNARKRDEDALRDAKLRASEGIFLDLLQVVDSFDMAFSNKEVWEKVDQSWRTGVEYISQQLLSILTEKGVVVINPDTTTAFDPNVHESVGEDVVEDATLDGKVVSVIQKGYLFKEKLLRPAKVRVGTHKN